MNSKPSSPKKIKQLLATLPRKAQRGSKPRCHLLTHGTRVQVAARLTALMGQWGSVSPHDAWLPEGFEDATEAELPHTPELLNPESRSALARWWLPEGRLTERTPSWDIAATCTVDAQPGLLLVEAKAHTNELQDTGMRLDTRNAADPLARDASNTKIAGAIAEANAGLTSATGLPWQLRVESHYQLANRFAWSWKVAQLGIPVVLVYLGFLHADEMADRGLAFTSTSDWEEKLRSYAKASVPDVIWGSPVEIGGTLMVPRMASVRQEL